MRPVKVAQLLLEDASHYDRKSQLIDRETLASEAALITFTAKDGTYEDDQGEELSLRELTARLGREVNLLHVYGPLGQEKAVLRALPVPYVASEQPESGMFSWRAVPEPAAIISPMRDLIVPEAVEKDFFSIQRPQQTEQETLFLGTFASGRADVTELCELTLVRLSRFREDLEWELFETPISTEALTALNVWIDPAIDPSDYDGFSAEALVAGLPVVACRTPINRQRLEEGAAGYLVPPNDPNELAHAILAALFKPEVTDPRLDRARQSRDRFLPEVRAARLLDVYQRALA